MKMIEKMELIYHEAICPTIYIFCYLLAILLFIGNNFHDAVLCTLIAEVFFDDEKCCCKVIIENKGNSL